MPARLCVAVLLPIQLLALLVTMMRYQQGIPTYPSVSQLNPGKGSWHPVLGSWLPVLVEVAGLVVVAVLALRAVRPVPEPPSSPSPLLRGSSGENEPGDHHYPEVVAKDG